MGKTETGEFELVLGNRQLLSGLAVVAILFGVFFAMGYIVGRNSAPAPRAAASSDTPSADPFRPQAAPRTAPAEQPATAPADTAAAETAAPPTEPAKPAETAAPPKPEETAAPADQEAGQPYLQVMAVKRSEAEVVIKTLREKGFQAVMAPSPKEGIFRVLVGPFKDSAGIGKAKADLENLGFHPFVQK